MGAFNFNFARLILCGTIGIALSHKRMGSMIDFCFSRKAYAISNYKDFDTLDPKGLE